MPIERSSPDKLKPFFLTMIRRSFDQLHTGDNQIADYLAAMLVEFVRSDRWPMPHDAHGRRLQSVVETLLAALEPERLGRIEGERAIRKYVGDYTLFMSGLFRRFVERGGFLDFYLAEGKRSYQAVSKLDVSLYRPGFLLFDELSRGFEQYSGVLDYMRKCYFASASSANPFAGFFQQIEGRVRLGSSSN